MEDSPIFITTNAALIVFSILGLCILYAFYCFYDVPESYVYTVKRFGKFKRCLTPGINFLVPFIEKVATRVNTEPRFLRIRSCEVLTRDNMALQVRAVVLIRVYDALKVSVRNRQSARNFEYIATKGLKNAFLTIESQAINQSAKEVTAMIIKSLKNPFASLGFELIDITWSSTEPKRRPSIMSNVEQAEQYAQQMELNQAHQQLDEQADHVFFIKHEKKLDAEQLENNRVKIVPPSEIEKNASADQTLQWQIDQDEDLQKLIAQLELDDLPRIDYSKLDLATDDIKDIKPDETDSKVRATTQVSRESESEFGNKSEIETATSSSKQTSNTERSSQTLADTQALDAEIINQLYTEVKNKDLSKHKSEVLEQTQTTTAQLQISLSEQQQGSKHEHENFANQTQMADNQNQAESELKVKKTATENIDVDFAQANDKTALSKEDRAEMDFEFSGYPLDDVDYGDLSREIEVLKNNARLHADVTDLDGKQASANSNIASDHTEDAALLNNNQANLTADCEEIKTTEQMQVEKKLDAIDGTATQSGKNNHKKSDAVNIADEAPYAFLNSEELSQSEELYEHYLKIYKSISEKTGIDSDKS